MRSVLASSICVLVLFLGGCTAGEEASEETTPPPAVDEATEVARASVERWAGLVAERQLDLDDWYVDWEAATCSSLASSAPDCNIYLLTASYIAQTNHTVIAGASDSNGGTYLGEVPAEIQDLYNETINLTQLALDAGQNWVDANCGIGVEGDCIGLAFDFESAMSEVRSKFAAWAPYL